TKFPNGMEYARQTDIGKAACTGDWLFYIQSDEVVHEKYLPEIKQRCADHMHNVEVEGFLFRYLHFWGDYDHVVVSHALYPREIRIIRNDQEIHSWRDAQSFRRIPGFDNVSYYQRSGTRKLNVIALDACVYHYGFVRPPRLMQKKRKNHNTNYRGQESTTRLFGQAGSDFDYGDLSKLTLFEGTHPAVMKGFIRNFSWRDQLHYTAVKGAAKNKHEKLKYRVLTFFEQNVFGGRQLFGFKNYKVLKKLKSGYAREKRSLTALS
ncbi:MAG TPA: hypothetical protein VF490_11020, partial [Chryseosolibacter sp.]